jgi:uncharacterized protein YraI
LTKYQTLPYDTNKFKHGGIMKKLLIALAIMAFLFMSSCASSSDDNETNDDGTTGSETQYPTVKNPITKIELSGKNNLVFK